MRKLNESWSGTVVTLIDPAPWQGRGRGSPLPRLLASGGHSDSASRHAVPEALDRAEQIRETLPSEAAGNRAWSGIRAWSRREASPYALLVATVGSVREDTGGFVVS